MKKIIYTGLAALLCSTPFLVNAEGLERINIDPSFMFTEGSRAEIGFANINPSLPTVKGTGSVFTFKSGLDVAPSFSALTGSVKTEMGDNFDLGLFYTNQGNGVGLDYGEITGPLGAKVTIKADLEMPTLAALGRYKINDSMSVFVGAKQSTVKAGATLKLGSDITGDKVPDVTSHWELSKKAGIGAVYGAAYEMPEIAMRVVLTIEDDIDLKIPATAKGGAASTGTATASIGDAISLNFQTGIAEDTLLFGNIRRSSWKDNQVKVPTAAGPAEISSFSDGDSYSLGIGRKINDDLSLSISGFYDGSSGGSISELAPTGATKTLSLGGKYAISDNADLSFGGSYSQRGDALTANYKASLTDSKVISLGAKVGFSV